MGYSGAMMAALVLAPETGGLSVVAVTLTASMGFGGGMASNALRRPPIGRCDQS